jgi:pyrophosphatase PpaX
MTAGGSSTFLFDLDGTLIDSIDLILSSYRHTTAHHGLEPRDDRFWIAGLGTPLWTQFSRVTQDPAQVEAMAQTYREHNLANHDRLVRPYAGVAEAVAALARRGTLGSSRARHAPWRRADPATTVFVGDSPHDMAAGRAAGVRTAAALWGPFARGDLEPHAPDFWLERPDDLSRL